MKTVINFSMTAAELTGMGNVIDAYYGIANEMCKVVADTELVLIDFSVVEEIKLALGMSVTKAESFTLDTGATVAWEYSVNKEEISCTVSLEADMAVYGPLFAAYTDIINTYGMILVGTAKELRPLVMTALEIKEQTTRELEVATINLKARHEILGGK